MTAAAARRKTKRVREGTVEPLWVTPAAIEAIQQALLSEHGGSAGVRDEGGLQSALGRPRNKFAYGEKDLAVLAASYAFAIARTHPFVDGNKRTAFQAMYVFLGLNGMDLDAEEAEVVDVMVRLAAGKVTEAGLADWVRSHLQRRAKRSEHL